jgi:two-component system chemotaxis response regulator CheB
VPAKIVVIGSSTGGPRALQILFQNIPEHFPVPIVVAQHMPPNFTDALARRLNETCPLNVVEAVQGMILQAGKVYIAPGGMHMRIAIDGTLDIKPEAGESPYKPSVDVLAESAFKAYSKQVIGVMLTGMGNDGAKAFLELRNNGAYLIAQDQATCVVYGMPKAVVENGAANEAIGLELIGKRLCGLVGL